MPEFADVVSRAMGLPVGERADLSYRLIVSSEEEPKSAQGTLEELLVARQRRVQSGDFVAYEVPETLKRVRRSLDRRSEPRT